MFLKILNYPAGGLDAAEGELNAAGITRLRLIPAERIQIILPDLFPIYPGLPDLYIDSRSILLMDEVDFIDVEVIPQYATYTETLNTDPNGEFYSCSIQITIPKDRPAITAWLHRKRSVRWVALIRDRNGFNRMVGTSDQPLRLDVTNSLGTPGGQNARRITFSANTLYPALYLESLESADIFASTEFDFSFNFDFNT